MILGMVFLIVAVLLVVRLRGAGHQDPNVIQCEDPE